MRRPSTTPHASEPEWADAVRRDFRGTLDCSTQARHLYAQDASIYQAQPAGVAFPEDGHDLSRLVRTAAEYGFGLIPRAGGTSLAGQCVGTGLVMDVSRRMNRILRLDPGARRAWVEPGVVQDDLNDAAASHGLLFAPDTSTSRQACIGGMIGNNACGAYSIRFGSTRDHVETIDAVLSDGMRVRLGPVPPSAMESLLQSDTPEGRLHRAIHALVDRNRALILERSPKPSVRRRNTGYALDALASGHPWVPDGPPFNLARLLCGSEGTLALVSAAEVRLVPRPAHRGMVCAHFTSVEEACRASALLLEYRPAAVELMDGALFDATRQNATFAPLCDWVQGKPGAVLAIEYWDDTTEAVDQKRRHLVDQLRGRGLGYAYPAVSETDLPRVWAVRKAGLGLLTGIPGDVKPITVMEDIAVAPEDLAGFVRDMEALMRRHGCSCVYYGHASAGLIHYRPMLNLKKPADLDTFQALAAEVVPLVRSYRGSLSGEHGDGRLRAPFLREALTPELYDLCVEVKRIFDPRNVFNPGRIECPPPLTADLRISRGTPSPEVRAEFDWSRTQGLFRAAEACNGVGMCRQSAGRGLMCPTYMATGDEAMTTRGRANLLRQALASGDSERAWTDPDLAPALESCLACKGCQTECPSGVNMARLKAEWLQKIHDRRIAPLRDWASGYYAAFARAARIAPATVSALLNTRRIKRLLGIAPDRTIPGYAPETFARWFRNHRPHPHAGERGEVVLVNDEFTNYTEPGVGIAAVETLEASGWRVLLPSGLESGRTQISKGFLRAARRRLTAAVSVLAPHARRGTALVGLEPSALLTFRDEAPDLVPVQRRGDAEAVRMAAVTFEEFFERETGNGAFPVELAPLPEQEMLVHLHCHQRALGAGAATLRLLRRIPGLTVTDLATGCCGMAGSFGYEAAHYALSMRIANQLLFPAIRKKPDAAVCATGTSCRRQIFDGTGRRARHPAEVLRQALRPA